MGGYGTFLGWFLELIQDKYYFITGNQPLKVVTAYLLGKNLLKSRRRNRELEQKNCYQRIRFNQLELLSHFTFTRRNYGAGSIWAIVVHLGSDRAFCSNTQLAQKKKSPIDAYVIFGIWIHVQKALFALCHLKYGLWTTRFEATNRRGNTAQSGRRIHLVTRNNYCQKCSALFQSRFGAIITIVGSWQCVHLKDQVLSFKMNGHLWK